MFFAESSSSPARTVVGERTVAPAGNSSIPFFLNRKVTPRDIRSATFRLRRMTAP